MNELLEQSDTALGVGAQFERARRAQNLSQEEAARQLNLRLMIIQNLEQERFRDCGAELFVKGYIRSYCRLLRLDEAAIVAAYEAQHSVAESPTKMHSFSKRTQQQAKDSRLMMITYVIGLVVVALLAVWLWQHREKFTLSPAAAVNESVSIPVPQTQSPNTVAVKADATNDAQVDEEVYSLADYPQPEVATEQANVAAPESSPENKSTNAASDTQPNAAAAEPISSTEQSAPQKIVAEAEPAEQVVSGPVTDQTSNNEPSAVEQPTVNYVQGQIAMTFIGDCWVEVFDAKGDRVAYGVKKTGYVMNLSGASPFKVTLGQPSQVELRYNDEAVDLSRFPATRTAKFDLPLAQ